MYFGDDDARARAQTIDRHHDPRAARIFFGFFFFCSLLLFGSFTLDNARIGGVYSLGFVVDGIKAVCSLLAVFAARGGQQRPAAAAAVVAAAAARAAMTRKCRNARV